MMFVVMAALAIGFTSCGNKTQQPAAEVVEDTVQAVDVEAAFTEVTAQLSEQIEAKDANKLQEVLETVKTKIAEILKANPEAAKEYVQKVQDFLKENAEKIKEFAGENAAVEAAVNALTSAPAESILSTSRSSLIPPPTVKGILISAATRCTISVKVFLPSWLAVISRNTNSSAPCSL